MSNARKEVNEDGREKIGVLFFIPSLHTRFSPVRKQLVAQIILEKKKSQKWENGETNQVIHPGRKNSLCDSMD